MKLAPAILCLLASAANASDVFTLTTWNSLKTYVGNASVSTTTLPGDPFPPGWSVGIDQNEGSIQVLAAASRRKNQPGTTTKDFSGKGDFMFTIRTDKTPGTRFIVTARHTGVAVASAEVQAENSAAYAQSSTTFPPLKTREVKANIGQLSDEETVGSKAITKGWTFKNKTWNSVGGGINETSIVLGTGMIAGRAVANTTSSGSNSIASAASGTATEKIKLVSMTMNAGASNAGLISGVRAAYIDDLQIEVRNEFNAPLADWAVGGVPVEWDLPFGAYGDGTYNLIFWAPGSLRRKIVVNYVGSTGLTGIDAWLYMGDIDRNNAVTQAEVDAITTYIGRTWLDDGWRNVIPGLGCQIMDCDLNQDNQITAADYLLAVGNVGRVGD